MPSSVRSCLTLAALVLSVACGSSAIDGPRTTAPCLHNGSEFPPSACAQLIGTLRVPAGQRADAFVAVIDSFDAASQSRYSAAPVSIGRDGSFEMLVVQIEPLGAPAAHGRKTQLLELRVHGTLDEARMRTNILATRMVTMVFTPWGQRVEPTRVSVNLSAP